MNPYQEEPPLVIEDTKPEDMSFGETLDLSRTSAEAKTTGDATLPDRPTLFSPATIPVLAMMHINTKASARNGKSPLPCFIPSLEAQSGTLILTEASNQLDDKKLMEL